MANALYTKGKEYLLAGDIDLGNDDIRAVLVDGADYTPNMATDEALDDIPAAARVAVSGQLQNPSVAGGVFDADDIDISSVSGDTFEYIAIYKHTGTEGTSYLLLLIDTATGLPCTPDGSDVRLSWDTGVNKIFRLS
jgi:hypothetical protein